MSSNDLPLENLDTVELEKLRYLAKTRGVKRRNQDSAPIPMVSREKPLPLSFSQQGLWLLAQMEDVSVTYHLPAALHLRGDLDRAALRKSLDALMARHEALRSVFVAVEGEPHIELLPEEMGLPLIEHDLRDEPDAWEQLTQLSKEEARTPFDLSRGPLIRARLIRMGEQEYVFLLTQHHIVSDGWSMEILIQELNTLYRAFQEQSPDPLPPLAIQYPDYAAWQREWLSGERLQRQSDYWRQALADAPTLLELPTDRPRPQRQSFAGAYVSIRIDSKLTKALKQLSAQQGTTRNRRTDRLFHQYFSLTDRYWKPSQRSRTSGRSASGHIGGPGSSGLTF